MAKLTKTEKRAFDALLAAPDQTLGADALVEAVYGSHPPTAARSQIASVMRMLALKTESGPTPVVRTSGLGRGVRGVYQIKS